MKAIVLLSGGTMSTIALKFAIMAKLDVAALHLVDPDGRCAWSGIAALRIASAAGVEVESVTCADLSGPVSNLVRLAHATSAAVRRGASRIILGTTAEATANAEQAFFHELISPVLSTATPDDGKIVVYSPISQLKRATAIRWGTTILGVDLSQTDDCLSARPYARNLKLTHCGLCAGCVARRAAFSGAEVEDPATYASAAA